MISLRASFATILALGLISLGGCASFDDAPARRPLCYAYTPPNCAPLTRVHQNGSGERRGHFLGDVTVYGVALSPINFVLKDASLATVIDAIGGLPVYFPAHGRHVKITQCAPGAFALSLKDVRRREALVLIAKLAGKRIVIAANVEGSITLDVHDAAPDALLEMIASDGGLVIVAQAEVGPVI